MVTAVGTSQVSMSYRGAVGPWRGVRDVRNASAKQQGGRKRAGLMMCWMIIAITIISLSRSSRLDGYDDVKDAHISGEGGGGRQ